MQITRWEYEMVIVRREAEGTRNRTPDFQPQIDLNRRGAEGWELVAVVPIADWQGESSGYTNQLQYVFKRPQWNG